MQLAHFLLRCVFVSVILTGAACSSEAGLNVVQGKVLSKKQPAAGVIVTFHPKGGDPVKTVRPTGLTKSDGSFTLMTGEKAGAAPGEYTVTFIWPEEVTTKKKGEFSTEPADSRDRLGGKYADPGSSTYKAQIKSGRNELEAFELK
ncbi:MAG: hypothetical protein L0Y72_07550 [Gemmataceae bacterium]|nr:hypothetical protein [Gemmataceae bacterium]MCI0738883.1 hypothetical protein [Gemmataceae bacterium]